MENSLPLSNFDSKLSRLYYKHISVTVSEILWYSLMCHDMRFNRLSNRLNRTEWTKNTITITQLLIRSKSVCILTDCEETKSPLEKVDER